MSTSSPTPRCTSCCTTWVPRPPTPTTATRQAASFSCTSLPKNRMFRSKRSVIGILLEGRGSRGTKQHAVTDDAFQVLGFLGVLDPSQPIEPGGGDDEREIGTVTEPPPYVGDELLEAGDVARGEAWDPWEGVGVNLDERGTKVVSPLDRTRASIVGELQVVWRARPEPFRSHCEPVREPENSGLVLLLRVRKEERG